jgi:hypothetical protein
MIAEFFKHVSSRIGSCVLRSDPSFRVAVQKKKEVVLWIKSLPDQHFPFRFVRLAAIPKREEFTIELGWGKDPKFPERDYYSALAARGLDLDSRHIPDEACSVSLDSELISGDAGGPEEGFAASPPSAIRVTECVAACATESGALTRLLGAYEACGPVEQGADVLAPENWPAIGEAIFSPADLPSNWQMIEYLCGLKESDATAAFSGSVDLACQLLTRKGMPFVMSVHAGGERDDP